MATRLYLHNALFDTATYPGSYPDTTSEFGNQTSPGFPSTPSVTYNKEDATSTHRTMNKTIGNSAVNMDWTSTGSTLTQMNYISKFISPPLSGNGTISANQWVGNSAYYEANLNANVTFMSAVLYVWRPSTNAIVGFIEDYTGMATTGEPTASNTYKLFHGNFTAGVSSAVSYLDGDVIIMELYSRHQQSTSTAYGIGFQLDGPNEYTGSANNTTVTSDFAAYIETPQDIAFVTDLPATLDMTNSTTNNQVNPYIVKV